MHALLAALSPKRQATDSRGLRLARPLKTNCQERHSLRCAKSSLGREVAAARWLYVSRPRACSIFSGRGCSWAAPWSFTSEALFYPSRHGQRPRQGLHARPMTVNSLGRRRSKGYTHAVDGMGPTGADGRPSKKRTLECTRATRTSNRIIKRRVDLESMLFEPLSRFGLETRRNRKAELQ